MKKTPLRDRIRVFILLPILVGAVVTALVAIAPIFIQYSSWIDRIMTDIVNDQGDVLLEVSHQVGELSSGFLQIPVYNVLLVGKLIQAYYAGDLNTKADILFERNATTLGEMVNNAFVIASANVSAVYSQSMWYYKNYATVESLRAGDAEAYAQLIDCVKFDSFMLPISTNIGGSRVSGFYYGFNSTGLYYLSPSQSLPLFIDAKSNCSHSVVPYFDPRCRPWFTLVQNTTEQFLASIIPPYVRMDDSEVLQDVCYGVWSPSAFELAVCIGFNTTTLDRKLVNTALASSVDSFAFVMNSDGSVFSFPGYDRVQKSPVEVETLIFGCGNSSDAVQFREKITPYFINGTRALAKYMKDGESWLIAIQPVNVDMGTDQLRRRDLSAAVVMRESVLWDRVNDLKRESKGILLIESLVLLGFLVAMMGFGWM